MNPKEACIVSIRNSAGKIKGTGFLVQGLQLITCAHVISACGVGAGDVVSVHFRVSEEHPFVARVLSEHWHPGKQGDLVLLVLEGELPYNDELGRVPHSALGISLAKIFQLYPT